MIQYKMCLLNPLSWNPVRLQNSNFNKKLNIIFIYVIYKYTHSCDVHIWTQEHRFSEKHIIDITSMEFQVGYFPQYIYFEMRCYLKKLHFYVRDAPPEDIWNILIGVCMILMNTFVNAVTFKSLLLFDFLS